MWGGLPGRSTGSTLTAFCRSVGSPRPCSRRGSMLGKQLLTPARWPPLAIRACQAGHRVLLATPAEWVARLADAHDHSDGLDDPAWCARLGWLAGARARGMGDVGGPTEGGPGRPASGSGVEGSVISLGSPAMTCMGEAMAEIELSAGAIRHADSGGGGPGGALGHWVVGAGPPRG